MPQQVNITDVAERLEFVKTAAEYFDKNPMASTYGDIKPGTLFALRWGLMNDAVVVFKIDEDAPIENYVEMLDYGKAKEYTDVFTRFAAELRERCSD